MAKLLKSKEAVLREVSNWHVGAELENYLLNLGFVRDDSESSGVYTHPIIDLNNANNERYAKHMQGFTDVDFGVAAEHYDQPVAA